MVMVREARTSARTTVSSEIASAAEGSGDEAMVWSSTLRHHSPRFSPLLLHNDSSCFHSSTVKRALRMWSLSLFRDFIHLDTPGPLDGWRCRAAPRPWRNAHGWAQKGTNETT